MTVTHHLIGSNYRVKKHHIPSPALFLALMLAAPCRRITMTQHSIFFVIPKFHENFHNLGLATELGVICRIVQFLEVCLTMHYFDGTLPQIQ